MLQCSFLHLLKWLGNAILQYPSHSATEQEKVNGRLMCAATRSPRQKWQPCKHFVWCYPSHEAWVACPALSLICAACAPLPISNRVLHREIEKCHPSARKACPKVLANFIVRWVRRRTQSRCWTSSTSSASACMALEARWLGEHLLTLRFI